LKSIGGEGRDQTKGKKSGGGYSQGGRNGCSHVSRRACWRKEDLRGKQNFVKYQRRRRKGEGGGEEEQAEKIEGRLREAAPPICGKTPGMQKPGRGVEHGRDEATEGGTRPVTSRDESAERAHQGCQPQVLKNTV